MAELLIVARELYYWEAQRRDKLNSSSSIPIGFATTSGAIFSAIIYKIEPPLDLLEWAVLAAAAIYGIFGLIFFYHCVLFFLGPIYKYVAHSERIVEYYKDTESHHKKYPETGDIDSSFEEYLISTYSLCATVNCKNNDRKSYKLYVMHKLVLFMFGTCLLSGLMVGFSAVYRLAS